MRSHRLLRLDDNKSAASWLLRFFYEIYRRHRLVSFIIKLHQVCTLPSRVCDNQTWCILMFTDLLQIVETTCMKLVDKKSWQSTCIKPVDNLQQTCYHLAGASNANASWFRLDDCKATSLQQTTCNLRFWLCAHSLKELGRERSFKSFWKLAGRIVESLWYAKSFNHLFVLFKFCTCILSAHVSKYICEFCDVI